MAHVLVVGADGGIGNALARALVGRGERLTATVHHAAELPRMQAELPSVAVHVVDLSDADRAGATLAGIARGATTLDAVVLCAGVAPFGPTEIIDLGMMRRTFEINTIAAAATFQATIAALRRTRGRFVVISSLAGRFAMPILPAYCASKFALEGLADVLRREVAPDGVSVIVIEPGGVQTRMVERQLRTARQEREALPPEDRTRYGGLYDSLERMVRSVSEAPPSTPAQVAEVIMAALDAAEPECRYVAGEDARQALAALAGASDRQADALAAQMFPH